MFFREKKKEKKKVICTCLICGYYYNPEEGYNRIENLCQDCSNKISRTEDLYSIDFSKDKKSSSKQHIDFLKAKRQELYKVFLSQQSQDSAINLFGFSLYTGNEIDNSEGGQSQYYNRYLKIYKGIAIDEIKKVLQENNTNKFTQLPTQNFKNCILCGEETLEAPFCDKCKSSHSNVELLDILNRAVSPKSIAELPPHPVAEMKTHPCFFCGAETTERFCPECIGKYASQNVGIVINNLEKVTKIQEVGEDFSFSPKTKYNQCLFCKAETPDVFCSKCSDKYAGKNLAIIINDLREVKRIQEVDKYYSFAIHRCEDGHVVRSKSEVIIDDFLYRHRIWHVYEKPLTVNGVTIHPDFYLPQYDVYIEHLGYRGYKKYDNQTEFKKALYDKKVVYTTEEDISQIEEVLSRKLASVIQPKYKELPSEGFTNCVICNAGTRGHAFCRSCWENYSDDQLLDILNRKR